MTCVWSQRHRKENIFLKIYLNLCQDTISQVIKCVTEKILAIGVFRFLPKISVLRESRNWRVCGILYEFLILFFLMPLVAMFVQCGYFQGWIWMVILHFKLELQTQHFGQITGSFSTIWSILKHVKCLAMRIQFAWFWINISPNCQSQPALWQEMTFSRLHCRPIHHNS